MVAVQKLLEMVGFLFLACSEIRVLSTWVTFPRSGSCEEKATDLKQDVHVGESSPKESVHSQHYV